MQALGEVEGYAGTEGRVLATGERILLPDATRYVRQQALGRRIHRLNNRRPAQLLRPVHHGNLGYGRCVSTIYTNDVYAVDYPLGSGDNVFSPFAGGTVTFALGETTLTRTTASSWSFRLTTASTGACQHT